MKKLVKTAKQQFEERLSELNIFNHQSLDLNETFYCGLNSDNQFIMLLNDGDANYIESGFIDEYEAVITSEKFLSAMIERFNEGKREIKPLFDWYASADHEITESSPLDLRDLFNLGIEEAFYQFEDLYEEVPDVRIITAKEQWEEDSKDAKVAATPGNGSIYKVDVTEQAITFYVFKGDCYSKSVFPPFSELRKDNKFVIKYLELVRMSHDGDMDYALSWLAGGEYKMCELSLLDIYESATEIEGLEYEDKELPQEQTIEEMIALTPEQQDAVKAFEVAFEALKDSGVRIISYWDENEFFAVNGNSNVELDCSYYSSKEDYENSEDISVLLQKKHRFPFSWDLYWGVDTCFCAKKL